MPEITIKISMSPDEVTVSQVSSSNAEESFAVPPVPDLPEAVSETEPFIPPVPEVAVLMYGEDEDIAPPVVREADMMGDDEYIEPPEIENDIVDSTADELPDLPSVE